MKKTPLIGFAGKAGVGKDTAAAYVNTRHSFVRYAFAQPIKLMLEAAGFPQAQFENHEQKEAVISEVGVSYRRLAQTLGTEWGRSIHSDFWLILARRRYAQVGEYGFSGFAISDVRFDNEAEWIRNSGGRVVHILGRDTTVSGEAAQHVSEAGVKVDYLRDYFVRNDGDLANLYEQLDVILQQETRND